MNIISRRKGIAALNSYFLLTFVLAIYLFGTLSVTGAGTIFDLKMYGIEIRSDQINLFPFSQDIDIMAYLQNILLFIPFSFLLALIWPHYAKWKFAVLSGCLFSLLIELSQLLNNRQTDIDDLILNIVGTALGYFLYQIFISVTKWNNERLVYYRFEPVVYVCAMFLGHFLFYNEFGLAKILYGF